MFMRSLQCVILSASILLFSNTLLAQNDVIRQQSCDVAAYQQSIDSVKRLYETQGFTVLREASMSMESEYEMPVILPMTQGTWYQVVFIGDPTSRLYEVRMYDWSERQVFYKKHLWGDIDGNIISYAYIPKGTEYHMIKPVQVNKKKKKLCGYILLLKKTEPAGQQQ
jgi:hypothetical protein